MIILQQSRGHLSSGDQCSLDLPFAATKSLAARIGPTPTFTRSSSGTFVNENGIIVGKTTSPTSINPASVTVGGLVIFDVPSGSIVGWLNGSVVTVMEDTDGDDQIGAQRYISGTITNKTDTQLTLLVTAKSGTTTLSSWFVSYRGARFDHDPLTPFACKGLLIEESRTNLLFPSATLSTQTRTVTAVAHTLSFYGSGTIVLSGAHSATVVGTGAYPARRTLTFTPTAGSLTLTVTGTVEFAQLEAGSFATSYIPTTTASAVRSADVCSILSASSVINNSQGVIEVDFSTNTGIYPVFVSPVSIRDSTGANGVSIELSGSTATAFTQRFRNYVGGASTNTNITGSLPILTTHRMAVGYEPSNSIGVKNSVLTATNASTLAFALPVNQVIFGGTMNASTYLNGCVSGVKIYRRRLSNAKLQALTA